jgi:ATP-binding cassette subfamily F protein 3
MRKVQGSVAKLKETIAIEEEVALRTQENDAKKREQLEKFITRFRAQATKAAAVQSKVKAVEKLSTVERIEHERNLDFVFNEAPFPGKRMMQIKNLSFHFPEGPLLINDLSAEIFKGDRIGIIGPNGRGKTTLLNLITNELQPVEGSVELNPNVMLNYFGQTNINRLHLDNNVEEEIQTAVKDNARGRARSLAGLMMFSGDSALKKIKVLSGGERSRVLLGKILATACNLLLLDEPTNHLDMESIESLIDALEDYQGTAIVVTHDEELLHAFATRLIVFDGGQCLMFDGTYQDFLDRVGWVDEKSDSVSKLPPQSKSETSISTVPSAGKDKDSRRARANYIAERSRIIKPLEKKLTSLEEDIKLCETQTSHLEEILIKASEQGNATLIAKTAKEIDDFKVRIDNNYAIWDKTNAELESVLKQYPLEPM